MTPDFSPKQAVAFLFAVHRLWKVMADFIGPLDATKVMRKRLPLTEHYYDLRAWRKP